MGTTTMDSSLVAVRVHHCSTASPRFDALTERPKPETHF